MSAIQIYIEFDLLSVQCLPFNGKQKIENKIAENNCFGRDDNLHVTFIGHQACEAVPRIQLTIRPVLTPKLSFIYFLQLILSCNECIRYLYSDRTIWKTRLRSRITRANFNKLKLFEECFNQIQNSRADGKSDCKLMSESIFD